MDKSPDGQAKGETSKKPLSSRGVKNGSPYQSPKGATNTSRPTTLRAAGASPRPTATKSTGLKDTLSTKSSTGRTVTASPKKSSASDGDKSTLTKHSSKKSTPYQEMDKEHQKTTSPMKPADGSQVRATCLVQGGEMSLPTPRNGNASKEGIKPKDKMLRPRPESTASVPAKSLTKSVDSAKPTKVSPNKQLQTLPASAKPVSTAQSSAKPAKTVSASVKQTDSPSPVTKSSVLVKSPRAAALQTKPAKSPSNTMKPGNHTTTVPAKTTRMTSTPGKPTNAVSVPTKPDKASNMPVKSAPVPTKPDKTPSTPIKPASVPTKADKNQSTPVKSTSKASLTSKPSHSGSQKSSKPVKTTSVQVKPLTTASMTVKPEENQSVKSPELEDMPQEVTSFVEAPIHSLEESETNITTSELETTETATVKLITTKTLTAEISVEPPLVMETVQPLDEPILCHAEPCISPVELTKTFSGPIHLPSEHECMKLEQMNNSTKQIMSTMTSAEQSAKEVNDQLNCPKNTITSVDELITPSVDLKVGIVAGEPLTQLIETSNETVKSLLEPTHSSVKTMDAVEKEQLEGSQQVLPPDHHSEVHSGELTKVCLQVSIEPRLSTEEGEGEPWVLVQREELADYKEEETEEKPQRPVSLNQEGEEDDDEEEGKGGEEGETSRCSTLSDPQLAGQSSSETSTPEELRTYEDSSSGVESHSDDVATSPPTTLTPDPDLGIHMGQEEGGETPAGTPAPKGKGTLHPLRDADNGDLSQGPAPTGVLDHSESGPGGCKMEMTGFNCSQDSTGARGQEQEEKAGAGSIQRGNSLAQPCDGLYTIYESERGHQERGPRGSELGLVEQIIGRTLLLAASEGGGRGGVRGVELGRWAELLSPLDESRASITSVTSFSPEGEVSPQGDWTVVEVETFH
ncbi:Hypothetical predicted protein [Pelobates cultripes]|nr:Hypothetical predicted protein [Pelobates cultripes]